MSLIARQHDHGGSTGGMAATTTAGVPRPLYMQRIFWALVGAAIGLAVCSNLLNKVLCYQRIWASRDNPTAAKPRSLFFRAHATISAIIREYGYYSIPVSIRGTRFYLAPLGPATILAAYVVLIVVCSLYGFQTTDSRQWEDLGYRAGYIAICQLLLIVLLAAKRNLVGQVTGLGYERLAWLHRWVARSMLLAVLIHAGFFLRQWGQDGYILTKIKADALVQRGIAAAGVLLWMIISSCAPIRGLSYEVFVVQHVLSWLGLVAALYLHVPTENQIWIWLPLAFWGLDRVVRAVSLAYTNLGLFHQSSAFLSCHATFEPLDARHTRVTIENPPVTWEAGQHFFLACHVVAPLSSHPFTVSSIPSDGKMEFIVRAKGGATRNFLSYAEKSFPPRVQSSTRQLGRRVLIDGPYSRIRPLRQFDSVLFLAGSTGATFTMPLMRDLVQQWKGQGVSRKLHLDPPPGAVTRYVRFIWVVKKSSSVSWFGSEFERLIRDLDNLQHDGHHVAVDINIYVTHDDDFVHSQSSSTNSSLRSADKKRLIPSEMVDDRPECHCRQILIDEDAIFPVCSCTPSRYQEKSPEPNRSRASSAATLASAYSSSAMHRRISILGGRPHVSENITEVAERALGEMAVVVCGPPGLVQKTRNAAARVSRKRGVHKGTGAQGIWVHAETFGYA
ncbi:metalloreductase [Diplocarpon rosae]|nr:metalloreductase [Diplocarpon rosae]